MQGRRVHVKSRHFVNLESGDYCFIPPGDDQPGCWYGKTPNGYACGLANHLVTEHEDGKITVLPSIKVSDHKGEVWHGYLVNGVWEGCAGYSDPIDHALQC